MTSLKMLLTAPDGEIRLRAERAACFSGERREIVLKWSPSEASLSVEPESPGVQILHSRASLVLKSVIAAATHVEVSSGGTSTTSYTATLWWSSGDPHDRPVRGEISFTSRDLTRDEILDMLRLRPNLKITLPPPDSYARAIGLFDLTGRCLT